MKIPKSQQKRFDALQPTRDPADLVPLFAQYPLNGSKITEDWKALLAQDTYQVMFHKGTEPAFHNVYFDHHVSGRYHCKACGQPLFGSEAKYESGTGWPSFYAPLQPNALSYEWDMSVGMMRIEVHCASCGGHLGHVFDDGPTPTRLRFCMNSASLSFEAEPLDSSTR